MRTTVTLDDDLLAEATELTGITERAQLLRTALSTLIAAPRRAGWPPWAERSEGHASSCRRVS